MEDRLTGSERFGIACASKDRQGTAPSRQAIQRTSELQSDGHGQWYV